MAVVLPSHWRRLAAVAVVLHPHRGRGLAAVAVDIAPVAQA